MLEALSSIIYHITPEFILYYFTLWDLCWRMANGIYSRGNGGDKV